MSKREFFPPRPSTNPTIYAYELKYVASHKGLLKIGYTERDAAKRIKEQLGMNTANNQADGVFLTNGMIKLLKGHLQMN